MNIRLKDSGRSGLRVKFVAFTAALTLTGAAILVPVASMAAEMTTQQTIDQLTAQIAVLTQQLAALSGKSTTTTTSTGSGACTFTRSLTVGSRGEDVRCLQQSLNANGYEVAASGPGSPGNESTYFGKATKAAVAKWQEAEGIGPAAGYFGPLSRAKYASMAGSTSSGSTTTTTTTSGGTTTTVPVGSGLTVTAPVDQPASQLAPGSAARVPFVKAILTASADGDVTVNAITAERRGPADDSNFDSLLLLDENGAQIGNTRTLSSDHKANLNQSFVVKAGTSRTITVAANMVASPSGGQIARFAITAVDAGTTKVNANLPIEGNGMTMNSNLTIGSVTMSIGSLDPGSANTKNVGTTGYYLASVKASVGSGEDVTFQSIRFNQSGSAATGDLANIAVNVGGKDYPAVVSADGKYYVVNFGGGLDVLKGNNLEFSIKADLVSGSSRTVDMDILRKSDIVVKGKTFGYNIIVGGGSAGTASAGAFSSNNEPFFNAYAATINKGSVLISSSNALPSGNVPIAVTDTPLGAFTFDVKGEGMQISSLALTFTITGTGAVTNISGIKIVDANGAIVAGPKDGTATTTFTDTWTAPVGVNVYTIKGKLSTTFANNDTVQATIATDYITAKGAVTGLTVSATPGSTVLAASNQTVKAAALALSVSPTPFAQNVTRGGSAPFLFATYAFDATQSGEDVRVSSVQLQDTLSATGVGDEINSCVLYDGTTALNTGSDVVNPSDPSSGTDNDITFSLTTNLIVPKGTVKKIDLKCNISSSAASGSTHAWGTSAGASNINSTGASTGSSISESVTTSNGSIMTVKTAGSFTVQTDASQPISSLILSGRTDVPMTVLRYHAVDEAINITDLTLTYASSTASTSDFLKATVWDGATKIGEAVWNNNTNGHATTTFSTPFVVNKDGDRLLTIKADIGNVSVTASTTAGRLLQIGMSGLSSSTGIGQSSGTKLGSLTSNDQLGNAMQIMKTIPTLAKIAVPSTSIPQTNASLYRFSVTADPAGPVALYKFTFSVSSSSVSATTSTFNLYGYSDSGFSQQAYSTNPLYSSAVGCVGQSVLDTDTNCTLDTTASVTASSTRVADVVFFFNPVSITASNTEAIIVPAGTTRYFEMRGNISNPGSGTGNSVVIQLEGDAARTVRTSDSATAEPSGGFGGCLDGGRGFMCTAAQVAAQSVNNDFVWSPMSTSTVLSSATSTTDWTNGFLVPGLPSTNMISNTFSN